MPIAAYTQTVRSIAYNAKKATHAGQNDMYDTAGLFADTFANIFAPAIQTYFMTCVGLPIGGPVSPGDAASLSNSIVNAAEQAMIAEFRGASDISNIAKLFALQFAPLSAAIAAYTPTIMTIMATPPAMPISPGGPVIAVPSATITPVALSCAQFAMIASFQGQLDTGIATLFAAIFSQIGLTIGTYAAEAISLPGGGPLQLA